jgi:hypothetical protein
LLIGDSGYGVDVAERAPFRATLPMWSTPYETSPNGNGTNLSSTATSCRSPITTNVTAPSWCPHVETDPAHRGQGMADRLMAGVLADLRASNRKIVPLCPFADTYIRERPEEQDLLA